MTRKNTPIKQYIQPNKKKINNLLDLLVKESLNKGNVHFALTINFSEKYTMENNKKTILEKLVLLEYELKTKIELLDFSYIVLEFGKNNRPHIHAIIGVKSLIGYNPSLKDNINKYFRLNYELDFLIKNLSIFVDIKKYFSYILKDIDENSNYHWLTTDKQSWYLFSTLYGYFTYENLNIHVSDFENKYSYIKAPMIFENKITPSTIFNFWNYYLILNNYFIYNDGIYEKIENSIISYKKIYEIDYLVVEFNQIFLYFYNNFKMHFENFDLYNLKLNFFEKAEEKLKNITKIVTNIIDPNFDILEFTDGLYFIKFNKFYKKCLINSNLNLSTLKYYNKTYHNLQEPKVWLENIEHALNYNKQSIDILKLYIANVFHLDINKFYKKRVLFIYGKSNTKKTTLIAKIFINYYGKENIGFLSNSKNFKFQQLKNKKLGLFDEFNYSKIDKEQFLKLFAGEPLLVDIKFKNPEEISSIPIIIISNNLIEEKNEESKEAFFNRIYLIEFINAIKNENIDISINEKLKNEEPNIIVHCNKELFKSYKKNEIKKKAIEIKNLTQMITKKTPL